MKIKLMWFVVKLIMPLFRIEYWRLGRERKKLNKRHHEVEKRIIEMKEMINTYEGIREEEKNL